MLRTHDHPPKWFLICGWARVVVVGVSVYILIVSWLGTRYRSSRYLSTTQKWNVCVHQKPPRAPCPENKILIWGGTVLRAWRIFDHIVRFTGLTQTLGQL